MRNPCKLHPFLLSNNCADSSSSSPHSCSSPPTHSCFSAPTPSPQFLTFKTPVKYKKKAGSLALFNFLLFLGLALRSRSHSHTRLHFNNELIILLIPLICIVLGFMFIALIWKFDFSPFMVLIIVILNDGTIMTICRDRVKPSLTPDSWNVKEIFSTGFVLGAYLAICYILLCFLH